MEDSKQDVLKKNTTITFSEVKVEPVSPVHQLQPCDDSQLPSVTNIVLPPPQNYVQEDHPYSTVSVSPTDAKTCCKDLGSIKQSDVPGTHNTASGDATQTILKDLLVDQREQDPVTAALESGTDNNKKSSADAEARRTEENKFCDETSVKLEKDNISGSMVNSISQEESRSISPRDHRAVVKSKDLQEKNLPVSGSVEESDAQEGGPPKSASPEISSEKRFNSGDHTSVKVMTSTPKEDHEATLSESGNNLSDKREDDHKFDTFSPSVDKSVTDTSRESSRSASKMTHSLRDTSNSTTKDSVDAISEVSGDTGSSISHSTNPKIIRGKGAPKVLRKVKKNSESSSTTETRHVSEVGFDVHCYLENYKLGPELPRYQLEEGETQKVLITEVVNPSLFWVQPLKYATQLEDLMKEIA